MTTVQLTRKYLRNPIYSIGVLLVIVVAMEGVSWSYIYTSKLDRVVKYGGVVPYMWLFIRSIIIPEICTVLILLSLLNQQHKYFHFNAIDLTPRAIFQYQLKLLPVVLLAFFIFNPITETVRFALEKFPDYSFRNYLDSFLIGTFSGEIYVRYLIPILLIAYVSVNISLISDYLRERQRAQEEAESESALMAQTIDQLNSSQPVVSIQADQKLYLRGKNAHGEITFLSTEAYFFTVEERSYYAELPRGRYLVTKTLNELETELDLAQFFRIKRDYIVNKEAVLNYAYWENGKYIVRLDTPDNHEVIVPRARMHEFKEWLQGNLPPRADTDSTADTLEVASS
ncbi:MAG: LytTR family transcriptional regulator [Hymenobacter sp.]|nr:MAG: LytTR family transcriptional regulator [Hymenobacter sp.]